MQIGKIITNYFKKKLGICRNEKNTPSVQKEAISSLLQFEAVSNKEKYDIAWKKIKEKYGKIIAYELRVHSIGELLVRFFIISHICEEDDNLRVFVPDTSLAKRICNKYLIELLGRKIYIIQEKDVAFWEYIFKEHIEELDISQYDKYRKRNCYPTYRVDAYSCSNYFSDDEIAKGEASLEKMGIKQPFVCLAARTAAYNEKTVGGGSDSSHEYRNMDFEDYQTTINYLKQQNLLTVKMGRMEETIAPINNCIDYAGLYANDFFDLYIASRCEFMVSASSGIITMAAMASKPVLTVNSVPICFGYAGTVYTDKDLYIPKKYYDINKKKYLSLREMIKVESQCVIYGERYEKMGIRFINNTPEEIMAATKEMYERIQDKWIDNVEDLQNYEKYMEIYYEMKREAENNPNFWTGGPVPMRMATTYLRNNLYLIE